MFYLRLHHNLISLQLTKKIMFWIICLTVIPMLIMLIATSFSIIEIGKEEQEKILYAIVDRLDDSLPQSSNDTLESQDTRTDDKEQVRTLDSVLQPVINKITHSFLDVGVGYYSIELDHIVAIDPNFDQLKLIKVSHAGYPYFNIYQTMIPKFGELDSSVGWQGKPIIYYAKPVVRDGRIIGYAWANVKTDNIYSSVFRNSVLIIIIWLITLALAVIIAYRFSKTLHYELEKFAKAFVSDENLSTSLIPELNPIFNKMKEHSANLKQANLTLQNEIEERRNIEEQLSASNIELIRSQTHLKTIFDGAMVGIVLFGLNSGKSIYNPAFQQMLGYSADELEQLTFHDYSYPEDAQKIISFLKKAKESESDKVQMDKRYIRKDGSVIWGRSSFSLIRNSEKHPEYAIAMVEDITKRKNSEEQIYFQASILDQVRNTIIASDLSGKIIYWNKFAEQMFLWTKEEAIGQDIRILVPENRMNHFKEVMKKLLTQEYWEGEVCQQSKDGTIKPFHLVLSKFNDLSGELKGYVGVGVDITEHKQLEVELRRLERLNLVGQMAAGIGHEVRNPMTTTRGFLQLLKGKPKYSDEEEIFDLMINELDRANSIITQFLSLARNKPPELELYNLNQIIDDLYPLLQADAINVDKSIYIEQLPVPEIKINRDEIHQLILNLVRNGIEAMEKSGKIIIKTFVDGEEIVLAIKDEGNGIDKEILDKIGTPFLTTKEQGTGLGLATCYNIAERNKAKIEVESSKNGTTFYVRFEKLA